MQEKDHSQEREDAEKKENTNVRGNQQYVPLRMDSWFSNRRWSLPRGYAGICIPVQPHLPATIIAHSLSSTEFLEQLETDTVKAIRHANDLNSNDIHYDRQNDDMKKILSSCVADELQKTYHITTK